MLNTSTKFPAIASNSPCRIWGTCARGFLRDTHPKMFCCDIKYAYIFLYRWKWPSRTEIVAISFYNTKMSHIFEIMVKIHLKARQMFLEQSHTSMKMLLNFIMQLTTPLYIVVFTLFTSLNGWNIPFFKCIPQSVFSDFFILRFVQWIYRSAKVIM